MFLFISSLINRPYAREQLFWATLVFIMLAGSFLRFYGISWDNGISYTPHPDERAILMKASELKTPKLSEMETLFNAEKSPLNPKWFPYGSFPLYALKTVQSFYFYQDFFIEFFFLSYTTVAFFFFRHYNDFFRDLDYLFSIPNISAW